MWSDWMITVDALNSHVLVFSKETTDNDQVVLANAQSSKTKTKKLCILPVFTYIHKKKKMMKIRQKIRACCIWCWKEISKKGVEGQRVQDMLSTLFFWEKFGRNGGMCTFYFLLLLFNFFPLSLSSFCLVTLHNQFITGEEEGVEGSPQPLWLGRIKVFSDCQLSVFWCQKCLSILGWPCFMEGASLLLPPTLHSCHLFFLSVSPLGSTWEPL